MLSKIVSDANPEMKSKSAKFAGFLCLELKEKVGHYMKNTVISLVKNLHHQHSKVRKQTLLGLQDVIVCRGAENCLDDALPQLKFAINDRSQDVRLTVYNQVLRHWLTSMEIHSLRKFEHFFVQFLLNGMSDENDDIRKACIEMIEEHGRNMREALIQLGEEMDHDHRMASGNENSDT